MMGKHWLTLVNAVRCARPHAPHHCYLETQSPNETIKAPNGQLHEWGKDE